MQLVMFSQIVCILLIVKWSPIAALRLFYKSLCY